MRHFITIAFFLAAIAVYVSGLGPAFYGAPLFGVVFLLIGLAFEIGFWMRLGRGTSSPAPSVDNQ